MISAGRIVHIFRHKGGNGEFTKTGDQMSDTEASIIQVGLNGEDPLIVSVRSKDQWFVLTKSRLTSKDRLGMRSIPLDELDALCRPGGAVEFGRGKRASGRLEVRLKDGSLIRIDAESPAPFVALTNVFMYLTKSNGKKALWPRIEDLARSSLL